MAVDRVANSAAGNGIAPQISGAISRAAQSTGISFQYLVTTARIESSLNPQAQAATSSAKGLYQFIDQTWLATVKQDGAELGMGQYADAITRSASGRYEVADPAMRSEILKLRTDPAMSAMMAGALARTNASYLSASTGKVPTEGELYAAHFLGPVVLAEVTIAPGLHTSGIARQVDLDRVRVIDNRRRIPVRVVLISIDSPR